MDAHLSTTYSSNSIFHNFILFTLQFLYTFFIQSAPVLRLKLRKPSTEKKVSWNTNTVDNENMGKKKSKCKRFIEFSVNILESNQFLFFPFPGCCIYKKPLEFGESSSEEDDDECEHCFGHVEKKKKNQKKHCEHDHGESSNEPDSNHQLPEA